MFANEAVPRFEFTPNARTTGRKVPPCFPGRRNAGKAIGHWLSVDHQDSSVSLSDFWDIALRHDDLTTALGEGFDDYIAVGVVFFQPKDRLSAHAV